MVNQGSEREPIQARSSGWRVLWRVVYLASIAAFALPFTTVKSCRSEEVAEYTGFDLIPDGGEAMVGVIVLAALLFLLSFVRPRETPEGRGACEAARWLGASVALIVVLWCSVGLRFLFSQQQALIGLVLVVTCWLAVYLRGLIGSVRRIPRVIRRADGTSVDARVTGLCVGVLALIAAAALAMLGEHDSGGEQAGAFAFALILLLPVALLVFFLIVAAQLRGPRQS